MNQSGKQGINAVFDFSYQAMFLPKPFIAAKTGACKMVIF